MQQQNGSFKIQTFKVNQVFPPQTSYGQQAKLSVRNRKDVLCLVECICYS